MLKPDNSLLLVFKTVLKNAQKIVKNSDESSRIDNSLVNEVKSVYIHKKIVKWQVTQQSNDSKYAGRVPNGFLYALEACLLMLELPLKLFICLEVLGNFCHLEVLSVFFVLSKLLGNPWWVRSKVQGHGLGVVCIFIFRRSFLFNNNRNILVMNVTNTTTENR